MYGINHFFAPNVALSGLVSLPMACPRALPWAKLFRPFGAVKSPKGLYTIAQGNALGTDDRYLLSSERAE